MERSAALETLQAELICPICLYYLSDPVTINCGHNFCGSCIRVLWDHQQNGFPCPVCRHTHEGDRLRANPQLGRLVDLARLLHLSRNEPMMQAEGNMCEKHGLALTLFCEDDKELVCHRCTFASPHQNHDVRSIEAAASDHRERFCVYIQNLKKLIAESQILVLNQDKKLQELKEQVEKQRSRLASEFGLLHQIVKHAKMTTFSRLEEEDRDFQQKFKANIVRISDHISTMKSLRKELAEMSVMSKGDVLRDIKSIKHKCAKLDCPPLWSIQFKKEGYSLPPLYSELQNIIQRFQEEVTLDPLTAHPSLCVSEDAKTVKYVRKRSNDDGKGSEPDDVVVLGSEGYSSGRHYWEVQVGDKPEWAVGVCSDAPSSQGQQPLAGQNRSWTFQRQSGNFLAGSAIPVLISVDNKPTKIGIFLDYELGQISFYNASDRSHIHSIMETFSGVLKPYFWVGWDSTPLKLCGAENL